MRSDPVVLQIYPRSFQDSDGDGIGDLSGIRQRLDYVERLGVDAVWLSPIHPSPDADWGYDVAEHFGVHPALGTLADFDALVAGLHARGLALLLDLIPNHTSTAHPWFRAHPDRYVWRDTVPNNWRGAFGGPAWSRDPERGRYYLHSFFPEQADLDWTNPEVAPAFTEIVRCWRERGVDGFRLDALEQLGKDPQLRDDPPAAGPPPLPVHPELAALALTHSRGGPEAERALAALRTSAGEDAYLVGEVYVPTARLGPYLPHLDAAFAFELLHSPPEPGALRAAIEAAHATGKAAWVLSNHDFPRLPDRWGRAGVRVMAMLLLTLPGAAFVFQGDELGMGDGPGGDPPRDRAGRDAFRHPMRWDGSPGGGFTTGTPWLPLVDPVERSADLAERDRGSLLWLYRDLIALRRSLGPGLRFRDAAPGTLIYERGAHLVVLNLSGDPAPAPAHGPVVLATSADASGRGAGEVPPHSGLVAEV